MNTNTPETNAAKRPSGLRACADGLDVNPDKDFAQKCMRHAADRMEQLERERDEARAVAAELASVASYCLGWHDHESTDTAIKIAAALKRWKKSK